jgi:hypothetical protein
MTPESSRAPDPNDNDMRQPAGTGDALDPPASSPDVGEAADDPADLDEAGDDLLEFVDVDVQHRLWLRAVVPLLQLRSQETDPSQRVQFALDQMFIAACERVARLLRSDLPSPEH